MKTETAVIFVSALIAAVMLWAAWRLAGGEPFYAACAMFVAAFWGGICGCAVWGGICRWDDQRHRDDYTTIIWPRR